MAACAQRFTEGNCVYRQRYRIRQCRHSSGPCEPPAERGTCWHGDRASCRAARARRARSRWLRRRLLPVDDRGAVVPAAFAAAFRPATILVSVMYANNEIGTISPVAELADRTRARRALPHRCDPSARLAAVGRRVLGVDLLSISAHKFEGRGRGRAFRSRRRAAGADRSRRRPRVRPALRHRKRAGSSACARARTRRRRAKRSARRASPLAGPARVRNSPHDRGRSLQRRRRPAAAGQLQRQLRGRRFRRTLLLLDLQGIAVSAGSACTSGAIEPSHVIAALGIGHRWCSGPIRFSLGRTTTEEEIDRVLELLPRVVANVQGKE